MARIALDANFEVVLKGDERYSVLGDFFNFDEGLSMRIQKKFGGLPKYAACVEKNKIAQQMIPYPSVLVAGSLLVWSEDFQSSYGFEFHPPFEAHAWLIVHKEVDYLIDFALPGVIERGIKMVDEIGPILSGRQPTICAVKGGIEWLQYKKEEVLRKKVIRRQSNG